MLCLILECCTCLLQVWQCRIGLVIWYAACSWFWQCRIEWMCYRWFCCWLVGDCILGWCASHGGVATERSIHVAVCGCLYCIANTFHDFSLNCNGPRVIKTQILRLSWRPHKDFSWLQQVYPLMLAFCYVVIRTVGFCWCNELLLLVWMTKLSRLLGSISWSLVLVSCSASICHVLAAMGLLLVVDAVIC